MWGRFENDEMMDCDVDPRWATHPSLRDVVANLSLLAHIVSRNHKCPLNIISCFISRKSHTRTSFIYLNSMANFCSLLFEVLL